MEKYTETKEVINPTEVHEIAQSYIEKIKSLRNAIHE